MRINGLFVLLFLFALTGKTQVSINHDQSAPHPSAGLELKSNGKGFLPPRMNRSSMYALPAPAAGLMVFCTDCGTGTSGMLCVFEHGNWCAIDNECLPPQAPVQIVQLPGENYLIWKWHKAPGATGYRFGSTDSYSGSIDLGSDTSHMEYPWCDSAYTRYLWAYSDCGHSTAAILHDSLPCTFYCGNYFTDTRDLQKYETVQIGNRCWMKENMNIGIRINGTQDQTNNNVIEKYCYSDLPSNCDIYGGLYQWGESVQYLNGASNSSSWNPSPGDDVRGICPEGWHMPADSDWTILITYLGGVYEAGGKMKEMGTDHWASPNTGATNWSNFTALPGGFRITTGSFSNKGLYGYFYSATETSSIDASYKRLSYNDIYVNEGAGAKTYGQSVRCIKNLEE